MLLYKIKLSFVSLQDEIKFTNVLNSTLANVTQQDTNCVATNNAKAKQI